MYMVESLCQYKDAFGKLGEGIHSYRIYNVAVLDFGVTAIVAYIITLLTGIKFIYTAVGLFLMGIIVHRLFCVRTTIDKWIDKLLNKITKK